MSFILIDVERVAMEAVFQHLQGQYPENMILLNPSQSECDRYLNMDSIIVVRPLIAEAPLSSSQGTNTPSIEKILVDIISDNVFTVSFTPSSRLLSRLLSWLLSWTLPSL